MFNVLNYVCIYKQQLANMYFLLENNYYKDIIVRVEFSGVIVM